MNRRWHEENPLPADSRNAHEAHVEFSEADSDERIVESEESGCRHRKRTST
jgi:hypothetical protein